MHTHTSLVGSVSLLVQNNFEVFANHLGFTLGTGALSRPSTAIMLPAASLIIGYAVDGCLSLQVRTHAFMQPKEPLACSSICRMGPFLMLRFVVLCARDAHSPCIDGRSRHVPAINEMQKQKQKQITKTENIYPALDDPRTP